MSQELDDLLKSANSRATSGNQRWLAGKKFGEDSTLFYNGGHFRITPEFIGGLVEFENDDRMVLIDLKGNPIVIDEVRDFIAEARSLYREAANTFLFETQRLSRSRKATKIIES